MARLGQEPRFEAWTGENEADALAFVISRSLHRRHLGESQRALAAARLATLENGQHPHLSGDNSAQVVGAQGSRGGPIGPAQFETAIALSNGQAAELLNVGTRSVKRARYVLECGDAAVL